MEWTTVTVIISLVGLGAAVVKPIVALTRSITELTVVVKDLRQDVEELREHSRQSHKKLWEHNGVQDERLAQHERRIGTLELKKEELA